MKATEFFAAIRKGKTDAAYFLCGPDRFLHEECRSALINSLPAETREWCLAEIEFVPGRLARELEGARQLPMLGGHTYLLFSDSEDFKHAGDADHEALADYLEKPSPFATVVFSAVEPDRRRKFIQLLEKKAEVVQLAPLQRREAAEWLRHYAERAGVQVDSEIAEEIAAKFESSKDPRKESAAGVNLLWARTELDKLLTARHGAPRLERADLDLIVTFREEHVIGKLLQAIAQRDFARALENLRALLASKESEMLLLWSVGDLFRQALKAGSAQALGGRGGPGGWNRWSNPFSTVEIAPQLHQKYSRQEILQALRHVHQADLGIKSSWKDSKILLEFLIWRIIVGRGAESIPAFELPAPAVEA
ncbi:MAG TPA: DNA polymerase III subunit delta [Terriglobia bacterium]|nr:DNA polymerase III subunit delta [Terriglobia bacterium]